MRRNAVFLRQNVYIWKKCLPHKGIQHKSSGFLYKLFILFFIQFPFFTSYSAATAPVPFSISSPISCCGVHHRYYEFHEGRISNRIIPKHCPRNNRSVYSVRPLCHNEHVHCEIQDIHNNDNTSVPLKL